MKHIIALTFAVSVSFYAGEASAANSKVCPLAKARAAATALKSRAKKLAAYGFGSGSKVSPGRIGSKTM